MIIFQNKNENQERQRKRDSQRKKSTLLQFKTADEEDTEKGTARKRDETATRAETINNV
jgi:hypothetical protein